MIDNRPCRCGRFAAGPYELRMCRRCWLAAFDVRYRRHWGIEGEIDPNTEAPINCCGAVPTVTVADNGYYVVLEKP